MIFILVFSSAFVDQQTGEYGERRLSHTEEAVRFYRSLAGEQVRVGAEATGNFRWFKQLLNELGHEFLLGDASAIRASQTRKQKTDKRDARHILKLLVEDRFPEVWQAPASNEHLRQLLYHRCRMVQMRTRVKNQLDSVAKNEGLLGPRMWSPKRREQIEALPLQGWYGQRRNDLLVLLELLNKQIEPLDEAVRKACEEDVQVRLLMTHPGVGPVVGLAYMLILGDWQRFPRGKQVGSYLGLIPTEESSADKRRLGHISKQGNTMLRWPAGGGCKQGPGQGSELAPAVRSFIDGQASRRSQGGHRTQTGGSSVLDVALRAELPTDDGARFACGAVRLAQWSGLMPTS